MKRNITLLLLFVSLLNGMEVETEQPYAWYTLPEEVQLQIAAYSDPITKESLHYVNKQLSKIVCKNNIIALLNYVPCPLHQQDHLDAMVLAAKKDNVDAMRQLIKNAPYCDHADWLDVLPYFIADNAPGKKLLEEYTSDRQDERLERLLPGIMLIYEGYKKVLEDYKIRYKYQEIRGYSNPWHIESNGSACNIYVYVQHHLFDDPNVAHLIDEYATKKEETKQYAQKLLDNISPLHIAVARKHPVSVAQLLLSQNKELLNKVDECWPATPIMMHPTVEMCKFLLSHKNIYLGEPGPVYNWQLKKEIHHKESLLAKACRYAPLQIVTAIFEHLERNKHTDPIPSYNLCLNTINQYSDKFLYVLDKAHIHLTNEEILQLFSKALEYEALGSADVLIKKYPHLIDINATTHKLKLQDHDSHGCLNEFTNATPLFAAAAMYQIETVKWLLERGANPDITDSNGKKPIDVAFAKVKELLSSNMNIDK